LPWSFPNGQRLYFSVGGSRIVIALADRMAPAAPSIMPVLGWLIHDGRCCI
jgi:hypothetical protein